MCMNMWGFAKTSLDASDVYKIMICSSIEPLAIKLSLNVSLSLHHWCQMLGVLCTLLMKSMRQAHNSDLSDIAVYTNCFIMCGLCGILADYVTSLYCQSSFDQIKPPVVISFPPDLSLDVLMAVCQIWVSFEQHEAFRVNYQMNTGKWWMTSLHQRDIRSTSPYTQMDRWAL